MECKFENGNELLVYAKRVDQADEDAAGLAEVAAYVAVDAEDESADEFEPAKPDGNGDVEVRRQLAQGSIMYRLRIAAEDAAKRWMNFFFFQSPTASGVTRDLCNPGGSRISPLYFMLLLIAGGTGRRITFSG